MSFSLRDKAIRFHNQLPNGPRHALTRFGIHPLFVRTRLLGWDGTRITVPIFSANKEVLGFEYWKQAQSGFEVERTERVALYGADDLWVREQPTAVITEGIAESLVARSQHFDAISATGSGRVFEPSWVTELARAGEVFVCFTRSPESLLAARKIASILPRAHVVILPYAVGRGGGLSDFFTRLKATRVDFLRLLAEASSLRDE